MSKYSGGYSPQPTSGGPGKPPTGGSGRSGLGQIRDSGHRREFRTGAVRDMDQGKGRYDLIPWEAIEELAKHCEVGALKYGERNCEKGIPISSLIDSAFRHLSKYMQGADDEPHLRAALWNIAFAIWTEKERPDMQDIPSQRS